MSWWTIPRRPGTESVSFTDSMAAKRGAEPEQKRKPEFVHNYAYLLDLSQHGSSVLVDRVPETDRPVWIRLDGNQPTDWVEAKIVGIIKSSKGPHVARLLFRGVCPYDFFKAAVFGGEKD